MANQTDKTKFSSATGFGMVELLIVITLVGTLSTIALINITKSNRSVNVASSMRALSAYLEKARTDSVRRHGAATISLDSTSSYTISIDADGDGNATDSKIALPAGTSISYSLPPAITNIAPSDMPITIAYDWRGRTASTVVLTLVDSTSGVTSSTLSLGPAGDITVDTAVTGPVTTPTPQNTTVITTTGIKSMH
jgi:Tfp pilus assembly protein FimT